MNYNYGRLAGTVLFIGAVQFLILLIVAEALYPGYSVADRYISDLGVGPSALIFNSSIVVLGATILAGSYLIWREFRAILFCILLAIAGIGAIGVGVFTEDAGTLHTIFSVTVFLFGGLAAINSYELQKPPLSYLAVLLGIASIAAMTLTGSNINLGLGNGGMERMIAYPILLWGVGFSGHLITYSKESTKP